MSHNLRYISQLLGAFLFCLLLFACYQILSPFLVAIVLGLVLAIAAWPFFRWLVEARKVRESKAAFFVAASFFLVIAIPLGILAGSFGANLSELRSFAAKVIQDGPPPPPQFLQHIPIVGERLYAGALDASQASGERVVEFVKPHVSSAFSWLVAIGATIGSTILQFLIAVAVSFLFLKDGEKLVLQVNQFFSHIVGPRAEQLLRTAALTLKSVVYGVLGTAALQAILAGIGFVVVGIPGATLLGFATFFLSLIPIGPPVLWLPVAIYVYSDSGVIWGTVFLLWNLLVVSGADNFIKPYLISRGSPLPLLLVIVGVLGGALSYGFLGLFLGPTLLAVAYALLKEWVKPEKEELVL
jgi:predicted PurR-regulated permease PerM